MEPYSCFKKQTASLFDFYIKSSIHVALAVVALTQITCRYLHIKPGFALSAFIFFAAVTGYNFVKYAPVAKFRHFTLSRTLRAIQIFSLFCFAALVWYAFQIRTEVLWAAAGLGVVNVIYALPVLGKKQNLRSIMGIKIFVIALVWAFVTVILPVMQAGGAVSTEARILLVQRFLFVIALTLPFDIRDLRIDTDQLGTLPQLFGIKATRSFGALLLVAVLALEGILFAGAAELIIAGTVCSLTAYMLMISGPRQDRYFSSFRVEGIPILWWLLLLPVS